MNATVTFTKIESATPAGEYKSTKIDEAKQVADFRIVQMSPIYIRWADGRGQIVSSRELAKLKLSHTWATDF